MALSRLGPLLFDHQGISDGNDFGDTNKFTVFCNGYQIKQAMNMAEKITVTNNIISDGSPWGIMPIDSDFNRPNSSLHHRFFGVLNSALPNKPSANYSTGLVAHGDDLNVEYKPVCNFDDYLCMFSSLDEELDNGYEDQTPYDILNDPFDSVDGSIWGSLAKNLMNNGNLVSSGGKWVFTGGSNTDKIWANEFKCSRNPYIFPFTFETTLEWNAAAVGYDYYFNLFLTANRPQSYAELNPGGSINIDYFRIVVLVHASSTEFWLQSKVKGVVATLYKSTLSSAQKTPSFKIDITETGLVTVWVDKTGSNTYNDSNIIWGPGDPGLRFNKAYISYSLDNRDSTSVTARTAFAHLYSYLANEKPYVVMLPYTNNTVVSPDFYRPSEFGSIPGYINVPNGTDLLFKLADPSDMYKGSPLGFYTADLNNPLLVTGTRDPLTPGEFNISNGIIDIISTDDDSLILNYWNGSAYAEMNEFVFEDGIDFIKPIFVSPELSEWQLNNAKLTLGRAKPFLELENHGDILFTRKTCYYNGVNTVQPTSDGVNIPLDNYWFCNIWDKGAGSCEIPNPTQRYRLQILRQNQEAISSNTIPASERSFIGVFDSIIGSTDPNGYLFNSREAWEHVEQHIGFKQI